jgi:multimeric flavodoxin WrbA
MRNSKKILIIYHSQSTRTKLLADSVLKGVNTELNVETRMKVAFDANLDDLLWADSVIFGTPENFGYMSGALKDFFDRTYYPAQKYQLSIPYAIFVSAGNDGTNAAKEIDRIALGYPLKKVFDPVIVKGEIDESDKKRCEELGLMISSAICQGII